MASTSASLLLLSFGVLFLSSCSGVLGAAGCVIDHPIKIASPLNVAPATSTTTNGAVSSVLPTNIVCLPVRFRRPLLLA